MLRAKHRGKLVTSPGGQACQVRSPAHWAVPELTRRGTPHTAESLLPHSILICCQCTDSPRQPLCALSVVTDWTARRQFTDATVTFAAILSTPLPYTATQEGTTSRLLVGIPAASMTSKVRLKCYTFMLDLHNDLICYTRARIGSCGCYPVTFQ